MSKVRQFMYSYYKIYILTICFLWFLMFFLPWDWQIGGVSIYYFVMKKLFVVLNCTPKVRQKKSNFWGVLL